MRGRRRRLRGAEDRNALGLVPVRAVNWWLKQNASAYPSISAICFTEWPEKASNV